MGQVVLGLMRTKWEGHLTLPHREALLAPQTCQLSMQTCQLSMQALQLSMQTSQPSPLAWLCGWPSTKQQRYETSTYQVQYQNQVCVPVILV